VETVQCWLSRSSSNGPERARIKPLTTRTQAGKAIATHVLASPPWRRGWLSRLSASLPRHGENAWLRGAYRVGRGDAMTAVVLYSSIPGVGHQGSADGPPKC